LGIQVENDLWAFKWEMIFRHSSGKLSFGILVGNYLWAFYLSQTNRLQNLIFKLVLSYTPLFVIFFYIFLFFLEHFMELLLLGNSKTPLYHSSHW